VRVCDASAFIRDRVPPGDIASVPAVRPELDGGALTRFETLSASRLTLIEPDEAALDRVRATAADTGDDAVLSATDERLLAAALAHDATLVTDDYAMQNVASRLDVPCEPIERDGIDAERTWRFRCEGCGRTFDDDPDRCPVCGSDVSRTAA
jgi:UPF0271 protein